MAKPILPICAECEREMIPETNGVYVVIVAWSPPRVYEVYHADRVICPKCGRRIIHGYARGPYLQHFERGAAEKIEAIFRGEKGPYELVFEDEEQRQEWHRLFGAPPEHYQSTVMSALSETP